MPPKKKSQSKAAKDSGKTSPEQAEDGGDGKEVVVSEREERLHDEHDRLIAENDGLRRRLEQLRRENEFLQEEAERVRVESQEYLLYVGKRSQRRQDAIISLNDQNTRELEDIRKQKEKLEASFQEKEKKMRDQLLERETELANLRKELKELEPMKEIQKEQISLIRQLESEVMASRGKHAESLLRVKSAFLRQKVECQQNSERQLNQLSQKAHEEAKNVLQDVSQKVKEENQTLRQELLQLINQYRDLQAQKKKLLEQNKQLRREQQCQKEVRYAQRKLKNLW
ncbi:coiled-coil domain-containing protein 166 [Rana temporaria]|uniref:coiled-coil domain-containing protein 166 n=1 Tax=Rana temporaria TaxID=8407 RepID=UPI001AAD408D|nr:coiled-coil domain-containing protein 166 [Rana temporaria]XP_040204193.1 coiled-coil domain-containing protein 166 [Rana temporaria]